MPISFCSRVSWGKQTSRRREVYSGSQKVLFEGTSQGTYILYFTDEVIAEQPIVTGKGVINNRLSELFLARIESIGIPTHFIRRLNMREQLIRSAEPLTFRVHIYNHAVGSLTDRFGLDANSCLSRPILEYTYKNANGQHALIGESHIMALNLADEEEMDKIISYTQRINDFMQGQCLAVGLKLQSISLEFGRVFQEDFDAPSLLLIDEVSPDTCRFFDLLSQQSLEPYSQTEEGGNAFQELARRFGIIEDDRQNKGDSNGDAG